MKKLYKFIVDFIFLSFKFGIVEGWKGARFINSKHWQEQLEYYENKLQQHEKWN